MQDFGFGSRLYGLRKKAGLSQARLGQKVGLSGKTISNWENGLAKPGPDAVRRLAGVLGVPADDLLSASSAEKQVTKIVVTGGPCAGKTTAMSWIQNNFSKLGYAVLFVDETATELTNGGAAPSRSASVRDYQLQLLRLQLAKEQAFMEIGKTMKENRILVVCDRGAMDGRAYMSERDFGWILKQMNTGKAALRDRYDAVFHLVTAARGAEQFYTLENNRARTETVAEAAALDDRLISAWTGHPHFRIIDNSTSFEDKMLRLVREIAAFLGEPNPMENQRWFLVNRPDTRALERMPGCERADIVQTYLKSADPSEERRIRQRGVDGNFIYMLTTKKKARGSARVETEKRLSRDEYTALLREADPAYRSLRKKRYCLRENGLTYKIDICPELKGKAIMQIELSGENQEIVIPDWIDVIREVTGDMAWTNHALARK